MTAVAEAEAGAIVTISDLPVESDRLLAPPDWIERIRQRREAGDPAAARASLGLLQATHPQWALPADLRELATEPSADTGTPDR